MPIEPQRIRNVKHTGASLQWRRYKYLFFLPRGLGVDIVHALVTLYLSMEADLTYPAFVIEADLTQIPYNVYPSLLFPSSLLIESILRGGCPTDLISC